MTTVIREAWSTALPRVPWVGSACSSGSGKLTFTNRGYAKTDASVTALASEQNVTLVTSIAWIYSGSTVRLTPRQTVTGDQYVSIVAKSDGSAVVEVQIPGSWRSYNLAPAGSVQTGTALRASVKPSSASAPTQLLVTLQEGASEAYSVTVTGSATCVGAVSVGQGQQYGGAALGPVSVEIPNRRGKVYVGQDKWVLSDNHSGGVDVNSAKLCADFATACTNRRYNYKCVSHNTVSYSFAHFFAQPDTPLSTVIITDPWYDSKMGGRHGYDKLPDGRRGYANVPMPANAQGAPGSDGALILWDASRNTVYEFFIFGKNAAGEWTARQGGRERSVSTWDGKWTAGLGCAGSSISISQTGLSMDDFDFAVQNGYFPRAIYCAVQLDCVKNTWRWPAQRTDGNNPRYPLVSEGTRFILPSDFDVSRYPNLTPFAKALCETLRRGHPLIVADRIGADYGCSTSLECVDTLVKTQPERFPTAAAATAAYARLWGGKDQWHQMDGFPWDKLVAVAGVDVLKN